MTREEEIDKRLLQIIENYNLKGHYAAISNGENFFGSGFVIGAQWADEHPKSPWISVKERMPEERTEVFVRDISGIVSCGKIMTNYLNDKCWMVDINDGLFDVTHWMPIPELSKEDLTNEKEIEK